MVSMRILSSGGNAINVSQDNSSKQPDSVQVSGYQRRVGAAMVSIQDAARRMKIKEENKKRRLICSRETH